MPTSATPVGTSGGWVIWKDVTAVAVVASNTPVTVTELPVAVSRCWSSPISVVGPSPRRTTVRDGGVWVGSVVDVPGMAGVPVTVVEAGVAVVLAGPTVGWVVVDVSVTSVGASVGAGAASLTADCGPFGAGSIVRKSSVSAGAPSMRRRCTNAAITLLGRPGVRGAVLGLDASRVAFDGV